MNGIYKCDVLLIKSVSDLKPEFKSVVVVSSNSDNGLTAGISDWSEKVTILITEPEACHENPELRVSAIYTHLRVGQGVQPDSGFRTLTYSDAHTGTCMRT